jgi:hypothetical protein
MKFKALLFLALISVIRVNAQISIGVRGGASGSTVTKFNLIENITPDFRYKIAPNVAIFAEIPITEKFSLQPEIAYNQKGFRVEEGIDIAGQFGGVNIPINGRLNVKTHYIEVPVLAKFHFGDRNAAHYYFMVGPSVGFLADAGLRINVLNIFPINTGFPTEVFKSAELSGIAAFGFEFPVLGRIKGFTEVRYQHGFSRILDTPVVQLGVRNRTFTGGLGLKFALGS